MIILLLSPFANYRPSIPKHFHMLSSTARTYTHTDFVQWNVTYEHRGNGERVEAYNHVLSLNHMDLTPQLFEAMNLKFNTLLRAKVGNSCACVCDEQMEFSYEMKVICVASNYSGIVSLPLCDENIYLNMESPPRRKEKYCFKYSDSFGANA